MSYGKVIRGKNDSKGFENNHFYTSKTFQFVYMQLLLFVSINVRKKLANNLKKKKNVYNIKCYNPFY